MEPSGTPSSSQQTPRGWQPTRSLTPRGPSSSGNASLDWVARPPFEWKGFGKKIPRVPTGVSISDFSGAKSATKEPSGSATPRVSGDENARLTSPLGNIESFKSWSRSSAALPRSSSAPGFNTPRTRAASTIPTGTTAMSGSWMGTDMPGTLVNQRRQPNSARASTSYAERERDLKPRYFDRTWAAAGSRLVRNTMSTPRHRSEPPCGQEYGAHKGTWAQFVMPWASRESPRSAATRKQELSLTGTSREEAMRERSVRDRIFRHRGEEAAILRAEAAMPRGRFQSGSFWNSAAKDASKCASSAAKAGQTTEQMRPWHERLEVPGMGVSNSSPRNANPFAYKACLDEGRLKVLTNWRQGWEGKGAERYGNGELYVGDIRYGDRDGNGLYQHANGQLLLSKWRQNEPVGEGVQWSADRKNAYRVVDGRPGAKLSHAQASAIATELGTPQAASFQAKKPVTWGLATVASTAKARPSSNPQGDQLMATKVRRQHSVLPDQKDVVIRI